MSSTTTQGGNVMRRITTAVALAAAAAAMAVPAMADTGTEQFLASARENGDGTVTLPLHAAIVGTDHVYYVIFDTSNGSRASRLGVNESQKLRNAAGSGATQRAWTDAAGNVHFEGTVDFSPNHVVSAPNGFPPNVAEPGSVADAKYSPLVQWPDGTVDNAPQIAHDANGDGVLSPGELHDKVVSIDLVHHTVRLLETDGFQGGKPVRYVSTDSSVKLAAALEGATLVPRLNSAPGLDNDGTDSSRASLGAFVNGQTGVGNPNRQGFESAVRGEGSPLNVLRWRPGQGRYSPLWDVHPAAWTARAIAGGLNRRQRDVGQILNLVEHGLVTGPGGAPFAPADFVVNCPIVSRD
jgi:hypothetical protein